MFKLEMPEIIDIQGIIGEIFGDYLHKKRQALQGRIQKILVFIHPNLQRFLP